MPDYFGMPSPDFELFWNSLAIPACRMVMPCALLRKMIFLNIMIYLCFEIHSLSGSLPKAFGTSWWATALLRKMIFLNYDDFLFFLVLLKGKRTKTFWPCEAPARSFKTTKIQAKWWFSAKTKHARLLRDAFAGFWVVLKFTGHTCLPHGHAPRAAS